jgi:hypothetical protein
VWLGVRAWKQVDESWNLGGAGQEDAASTPPFA